MLYTTFKLARNAGACVESYRKYARHVGGVKKHGDDTPIPLTDVLEVCGLYDALWCLGCCTAQPLAEKLGRLLAADFAEHVLHFFEEEYPDDKRPREAIDAARRFVRGEIRDAAWDAARAAAWAAAWAAARDAARAAARDAARAAARDAARAAARAAAGAAAWDAAGDAARAAAWDAAGDAAGDAARAAARAAEVKWQTMKFLEVLKA